MSTGRMERTGATVSAIGSGTPGRAGSRCGPRIPVALEFDEDDVGLVDAALRMLVAVVGHLDRDRGVTRLALFLQQLAGERPARPGVDQGDGLGVALDTGLGVAGGGAWGTARQAGASNSRQAQRRRRPTGPRGG